MFSNFEFVGARGIDASGRTFVYVSSDSAVTGASPVLNVYADGQNMGAMQPGAVVRLPEAPRQWRVVPVNAALSGVVMIGEGVAAPGTVNGTVTVIDGSVQQSLQSYCAWAGNARTAAAGLFPVHAIACHFPPGAGFMVVRSLQIIAAAQYNVRLWSAECTAPLTGYASRNMLRSKRIRDAGLYVSVNDAAMYALDDSTTGGLTPPSSAAGQLSNFQMLGTLRVPANLQYELVNAPQPFVLDPGSVLIALADTAAATFAMAAEVEFQL